jgi:hypothetical protein
MTVCVAMKRSLLVLLCAISIQWAFGQTEGIIKGRVFDAMSNEPIPFANVAIQNTATGAVTDLDGNYAIKGLEPGLYNVVATYIGYESNTIFEVQVFKMKPAFVNIPMKASSTNLKEVEITTQAFTKSTESPVSVQTIGVNEIERNPGGNRDISRVIQSLPGVATSVGFRNDIIIRGGSPGENRFFLDGIEVPNINHFATQGSSGGPVGMINVNFLREVDFYTSAFPANRGNALSSVMELQQKEGNKDRLRGNFTFGSSDLGITLDGPIGKKITYLFSFRRSYLEFLFKAVQLPFLPTYNDAQYKVKVDLNTKNSITFIGLGSFDQFILNNTPPEEISDPEIRERNRYILGTLPENGQWSYTVGGKYTHFSAKSFQNVVLSRNHLSNNSQKYSSLDSTSPEDLVSDYSSEEIENKLRLESFHNVGDFKISYGAGAEYATYKNSTFQKITLPGGIPSLIDFSGNLNLLKYAVFGQITRGLLQQRLLLSFGLRTDFSDYNKEMSNPLEQLSPRLSGTYYFIPEFSFNFNLGRYYQLPPYTAMGYRNNENTLINRDNGLKYMRADHFVAGFEFLTRFNAKISVEGFLKLYDQYPFLLTDSVSLANLGADFGIIGNRPAESSSQGRSHGVEFLFQQKLFDGFYGIISYTYVRSEFKNKQNEYVRSSWDNVHLVSLVGGKKFKRNWELGARFRLYGGNPYTPFDVNSSVTIEAWNINQQGIPDWNRLNEEQTALFHQLDIRLDKKYFFKKWLLNLYLDVQNVYNAQTNLAPYLDVVRNEAGEPQVDPLTPTSYQSKTIANVSGTVLPTIGIIIEL